MDVLVAAAIPSEALVMASLAYALASDAADEPAASPALAAAVPTATPALAPEEATFSAPLTMELMLSWPAARSGRARRAKLRYCMMVDMSTREDELRMGV